MKALHESCGTIIKIELMSPLTEHILPNTCVAEAIQPYAHYYGSVPQSAPPHSIFLLVNRVYFLDEILNIARNLEKCLVQNVNFASAILEAKGRQFPAIRLKFFPDYKKLGALQKCLMQQGVEFAPRQMIEGNIVVRINKIFRLEETEEGIFMDLEEKNKGYFTFETHISLNRFEAIVHRIKNNSSCHAFDAVKGSVILNGKVEEMVRVFAEGIDVSLIQCVKKQFSKLIPVTEEEEVFPAV